jgi:hypothetical protein
MGAGSRAANKTACAVLSLPTLDLRPRLIASWEGATLVVKVGSGAVAADRALALRVVAVSSEDRLRLYGANLAPQQGNVDETVKLHVPAGFKTVCAEAMIVPAGETIFARALATRKRWEACPQRRAAQLAWVRLALPDPAG